MREIMQEIIWYDSAVAGVQIIKTMPTVQVWLAWNPCLASTGEKESFRDWRKQRKVNKVSSSFGYESILIYLLLSSSCVLGGPLSWTIWIGEAKGWKPYCLCCSRLSQSVKSTSPEGKETRKGNDTAIAFPRLEVETYLVEAAGCTIFASRGKVPQLHVK